LAGRESSPDGRESSENNLAGREINVKFKILNFNSIPKFLND